MRGMILAGALLLGAALPGAQAQNWPGKTVRIVVPHTAAAPFDGELRAFAQSLAQAFGQPFVLENRDGTDGAFFAFLKTDREEYAQIVSAIGLARR